MSSLTHLEATLFNALSPSLNKQPLLFLLLHWKGHPNWDLHVRPTHFGDFKFASCRKNSTISQALYEKKKDIIINQRTRIQLMNLVRRSQLLKLLLLKQTNPKVVISLGWARLISLKFNPGPDITVWMFCPFPWEMLLLAIHAQQFRQIRHNGMWCKNQLCIELKTTGRVREANLRVASLRKNKENIKSSIWFLDCNLAAAVRKDLWYRSFVHTGYSSLSQKELSSSSLLLLALGCDVDP